MQWYNEPRSWARQGNTITVTSEPKTDFWRKTHYGFIRDNGHFYHEPTTGDFTAEVKLSGGYTAQYDQAGLMVRADAVNWMKCGIEFVDGLQHVSAVVTRDFSDWSVVPLPQRVSEKPWGRLSSLPGQTGKSAPHSPFQTSSQNPPALWLRVTRTGSTVEVHYSLNGTDYTLHRAAYLPLPETVGVGLMCASPEGDGFPTTFEGLTIHQLQEQ